jgi:hypothetical protein
MSKIIENKFVRSIMIILSMIILGYAFYVFVIIPLIILNDMSRTLREQSEQYQKTQSIKSLPVINPLIILEKVATDGTIQSIELESGYKYDLKYYEELPIKDK